MTSAIGMLLAVLTVAFTAFGAYLAARANRRDQEAARLAVIDKAVTDAKAPLIAENARLSSDLLVAKARITQLEDWLYGGGVRDD